MIKISLESLIAKWATESSRMNTLHIRSSLFQLLFKFKVKLHCPASAGSTRACIHPLKTPPMSRLSVSCLKNNS